MNRLSLLNGFTHVSLNPLQNKHSPLHGKAAAPEGHSQLHWERFPEKSIAVGGESGFLPRAVLFQHLANRTDLWWSLCFVSQNVTAILMRGSCGAVTSIKISTRMCSPYPCKTRNTLSTSHFPPNDCMHGKIYRADFKSTHTSLDTRPAGLNPDTHAHTNTTSLPHILEICHDYLPKYILQNSFMQTFTIFQENVII